MAGERVDLRPVSSLAARSTPAGHPASADPRAWIAVDPGPETSGVVCALVAPDRLSVTLADPAMPNRRVLRAFDEAGPAWLALETMTPYGAPVGRSVFDTLVWVGRFLQAWHTARAQPAVVVPRTAVKRALLGRTRGTDADIRRTLVARFGDAVAGLHGHAWAALAVLVAAAYAVDPRPHPDRDRPPRRGVAQHRPRRPRDLPRA